MNINESNISNSTHTDCSTLHSKHCFSWSAVLAGSLAGIGVSFLLNLLSMGLGFSAFGRTDTSAQAFTLAGFVVLAVVAIISMGTLGWVAGYVGAGKGGHWTNHRDTCNHGMLYGFIAWCLALILSIFLSAHIGQFISYSVAALSNPTVATQGYHAIVKSDSNGSLTEDSTVSNTNNVTVSDKEKADTLASASLIIFALSLIGVLSAAIAGHCGYNACTKKRDDHRDDHTHFKNERI